MRGHWGTSRIRRRRRLQVEGVGWLQLGLDLGRGFVEAALIRRRADDARRPRAQTHRRHVEADAGHPLRASTRRGWATIVVRLVVRTTTWDREREEGFWLNFNSIFKSGF